MYKLRQDPVFWSFFLTTTTAFIFGIVKIASKSKCKSCKFLGCCEIERDVVMEERSEEFELAHRNINIDENTNV